MTGGDEKTVVSSKDDASVTADPNLMDQDKLSQEEISSSIRGRKSKWDSMYQYLVEYKEIHGNVLVPNRYEPFPSLGAWVSTQRRHYKIFMEEKERNKNKLQNSENNSTPLTQERIDSLESIGFVWATTDPRHVPWEDRFQELCTFKEVYGHCLVPIGFKENPQLANWVSTQRQEWKFRKTGLPCRLTPDKIEKLQAVGFIWEAQRGGKKRKTQDCSNANNNTISDESLEKDLEAVTAVIATELNRGNEPTVSSDVEPKLWNESLGDPVDVLPKRGRGIDDHWMKQFLELKRYKEQHGDTLVPNRYKENRSLGQWVSTQRRQYKLLKESDAGVTGKLSSLCSMTPERISLLESVGFQFHIRAGSHTSQVEHAIEIDHGDATKPVERASIDHLQEERDKEDINKTKEENETNAESLSVSSVLKPQEDDVKEHVKDDTTSNTTSGKTKPVAKAGSRKSGAVRDDIMKTAAEALCYMGVK